MASDLLAFTQLLTRSIVERIMNENIAGGLQPATVVGYPLTSATGSMNRTVVVHLDQDPAGDDFNVEVSVLTHVTPSIGDRVMVQRDPPWGAYVSSYVDGSEVHGCAQVSRRCSGGGG